MKAFAYRLIPPRPTFMTDMTEAERAVMMEHVGYWSGLAAAGQALAFGPVAEGYGLGIVLAGDQAEAERIRDDDPAMRSPHGFRTEITPFVQLVTPTATY